MSRSHDHCTRSHDYTAGQDTYLALMPQYARGAAGIVMMCDVTRIDTINNIRKWKKEAEKVIGSAPPSLLLVNKVSMTIVKS